MITTLTIVFFVFGLVIGSFLNVVIFRYNTERSFGGRSACLACRTTIAWYDLIPLFSFMFLWGRCRNCQTKISWQYPTVEAISGLFFALLFLKYRDVFFFATTPFAISYAYYGVIFALLLVIAAYDLRHKIIPDIIVLWLGILSFVGLFLFSNGVYSGAHLPGLWNFLAGPLLALPFAAIWLLSRGAWMGLGDAKLTLSFGWLFGIAQALSGVVLAFWSGAIIGVILLVFSRKHGMKSEIPFAPFLVVGALVAFLFELRIFPIF